MESTGKVIRTVFWDANETIFIDYLEKGQTMNEEYYASIFAQLGKEIKKKAPVWQRTHHIRRI